MIYQSRYSEVNASQFEDFPHPHVIICTGGMQLGFWRPLTPVTEGDEVFGPTTMGVETMSGVVPINKSDWIVETPIKGVCVLDNDTFHRLFAAP